MPHVIAVNPGSDTINLNGGRGGKENNIRAFPSRFQYFRLVPFYPNPVTWANIMFRDGPLALTLMYLSNQFLNMVMHLT